jgi:hypothetical protein
MKKILYVLFLFSVVGFISCGSGAQKKMDEKLIDESGAIKDCDDFLEMYEEWGDKYIKVIDEYITNPSDDKIATQYMEFIQEAMNWSSKWVTLSICADNEEYSERFEEVANEIEKKLHEIGL